MGAAAEADRTLFVGNLETKVTEELLFELFHQVSFWDQPFRFPLVYGPVQLLSPVFSCKRGCPSGHPSVGRSGRRVAFRCWVGVA